LETAIANYTGTGHSVALNSGTDALILALAALGIGPGDEVITAANSFIASAAAIICAGATPVFADVLDDQNIDPDAVRDVLTPRTKAIMPVHLTGRIAAMPAIMAIAEENGLAVVEDAAQAFGSKLNGRQSGTFGDIGCFSAHPLKNLNAAGDAGFFVTDNADLAARVRHRRNHGLVDRDTAAEWGVVSRMDTIQAAVLLSRIPRLQSVINRRRKNIEQYRSLLKAGPVFEPPCEPEQFNTFHTFVIQADNRDALQAHLSDNGVGTAIHYPVPLHLQPAAKALGYKRGQFPVAERQAARILSLPVHQFLSPDDIATVAGLINGFYA
jgi:dTDP-4-amino-4,6-dideoxygalactose transaminase